MSAAERADLADVELSITGRLASMTHREAIARVAAAGGHCVPLPTERTTLLVVGQAGPPVGDDGRITASLRRARELQSRGRPLRIVSEEDLLARLGLQEGDRDLHRLHTTNEVSRILGVRPGEVRAWVRLGLIRPARTMGRLASFDFAQVASARALVQLTRSGVTAARIRRSLDELGSWFAHEHPALAQLEALEHGGHLLVRLPDGRLAEPGGQLRLGFEAEGSLRSPSASLPARDADDPEAWFELGIAAEGEGRLDQAERAYRRALACGGPRAELCFNLGNTLHALGRAEEAARAFEQATGLESDYVEAWNNLGVALADLGRGEAATRAYRRALALAPDYADAHYNLAESLAAAGRGDEARAHWQAYLRQDPHSEWAARARARLSATPADGTPGPRSREAGPGDR